MALLSKKDTKALLVGMGFEESDFDAFERDAKQYSMYGFRMEQTHGFEGNLRALGDRLGGGHRRFYFVSCCDQVIVRAWAHLMCVTRDGE